MNVISVNFAYEAESMRGGSNSSKLYILYVKIGKNKKRVRSQVTKILNNRKEESTVQNRSLTLKL